VRALIALSFLLLGLAACGGDDSLSRGEWAARANAICRETVKKIEALGEPATSVDYMRIAPKANELGRRSIERLRELKAPDEIEADAVDMINGYERMVELQQVVYDGLKAEREGKPAPREYWRASNRALEAGNAADDVAERLRARDCARDPWQAPSQA
jgi:hypothetical protein